MPNLRLVRLLAIVIPGLAVADPGPGRLTDGLELWPPSLVDLVHRRPQDDLSRWVPDELWRVSSVLVVRPSFTPSWAGGVSLTRCSTIGDRSYEAWCRGDPNDLADSVGPADLLPVPGAVSAPLDGRIAERLSEAWRRAIGAARVPERAVGGVDGESLFFGFLDPGRAVNGAAMAWSPRPGTVARALRKAGVRLCEYARAPDLGRGAALEALFESIIDVELAMGEWESVVEPSCEPGRSSLD